MISDFEKKSRICREMCEAVAVVGSRKISVTTAQSVPRVGGDEMKEWCWTRDGCRDLFFNFRVILRLFRFVSFGTNFGIFFGFVLFFLKKLI